MMQRHGGEGGNEQIKYDFSVNTNPFGIFPEVLSRYSDVGLPSGTRLHNPDVGLPSGTQLHNPAMEHFPEVLSRYPDRTCLRLREAIGAACGVPSSFVVCGNGASELIYKIAGALRPKEALLVVPGFYEYEKALTEAGSRLSFFCLREKNNFLPDESLLVFLKNIPKEKKPEMIFLCSPNNPNGAMLPEKLAQDILSFCMSHGIVAVVDECFLDFAAEEDRLFSWICKREHRKSRPKKSAAEKEWIGESGGQGKVIEENGTVESGEGGDKIEKITWPIVLKALTKSHGLAGLRLGYLLSPDEERNRKIEDYGPPWSVSGIASDIGTAIFQREASENGRREHQVYFRELRNEIRRERAFLEDGLRRVGCKVYPSEANFILFYIEETDLPKAVGTKESETAPAETTTPDGSLYEAMKRHGILIRDCANYRGLKRGYYRIAVKRHEENKALLAAMEKWLRREGF